MPTRSSRSTRALARLRAASPAMAPQGLGKLVADRVGRIERGHRLLEDHRHAGAAQTRHRALAAGRAGRRRRSARRRARALRACAAGDPSARARSATCRSPIRRRCRASRRARTREVDAAHRVQHAARRSASVDAQVLDVESSAHRRHLSSGPSGAVTSRRPSPSRLMREHEPASTTPGIAIEPGLEEHVRLALGDHQPPGRQSAAARPGRGRTAPPRAGSRAPSRASRPR